MSWLRLRKILQLSRPNNDAAVVGEQWRPDPSEPRLILEREVLKVRLQMPALVRNWPELEKNAFSHPAYIKLREFIDTQEDLMAVNLEATDSDELKSFDYRVNG